MATRTDRDRQARQITLAVAAPHAAWAALGVARPGVYGFLLGPAGRSTRVRVMAGADALAAFAVTCATPRGRPLRRRLRLGALSDLARAAAIATLVRDAPRSGRLLMVAGSLAGAALAAALARDVRR